MTFTQNCPLCGKKHKEIEQILCPKCVILIEREPAQLSKAIDLLFSIQTYNSDKIDALEIEVATIQNNLTLLLLHTHPQPTGIPLIPLHLAKKKVIAK